MPATCWRPCRAGKEVNPKEILEWEKELVGVYVSSHPLQRMTADLVNVVTHGTINITEEISGAFVVLAGLIADVRVITTKKGDAMAFVRLEDLQGSVDVTVFPQLYRDERDLWETDKIVIVRGKVDSRNGRVSIVADSVQNYVEGVVVLEDTSSVQYRYRNGGAPQGPNIAPRKQNGAAQRPAPAAPVYVAPPAMADDDDGPYFDEASPFANDEPEWMMETGAPYEPTPPVPGADGNPRGGHAQAGPCGKALRPNPPPRRRKRKRRRRLLWRMSRRLPPPTPPVEPLEFRKRTARIIFQAQPQPGRGSQTSLRTGADAVGVRGR